MTRKLSTIFILIIFLFNTSSVTFAAASPQDIIQKNKTNFQQMSQNIIDTNKQITDSNTQTEKLNKVIQTGTIEITKSEKKIVASKEQMQQITKQVQSSQKLANTRLRQMYMSGYSDDYVVVLLTSKNVSDFFAKQEAVRSLRAFDKKIMDDLETKKEIQNQTMTNLKTENEKLQQLKNSNVVSLKQLGDKKKTLQDLVAKFNQEKDSAAQIIKENEESLVAHAISVINSQSSTSDSIKGGVDTLKSLSLQLNTASVKQKCTDNINLGNKKIAAMLAESEKNAKSAKQVTSVKSAPSYNRGGDPTNKASYTMNATAYTGGTYTAMGLRPVRDVSGISTIAVDPSVIPLGTKVYIPGYGYAICSDTGGAIKGNIIDLYMNSESESLNWGRRTVTLYVVAYPGQW